MVADLLRLKLVLLRNSLRRSTAQLVGVVLGGLVGIPGIVTLIATLAQVTSWIRYPTAAVAALVCGLIAVLLCVVGSRLITTAIASLTCCCSRAPRRSRASSPRWRSTSRACPASRRRSTS